MTTELPSDYWWPSDEDRGPAAEEPTLPPNIIIKLKLIGLVLRPFLNPP